MQGAIIENGLVTNVILLPDNFTGNTWGGKQLVLSDIASIGDSYIDGEFVKPVVELQLDNERNRLKALVKAKRDALELAGFPYMGKVFDSDPRSFYRITTANDAASKDSSFVIDWKTQDNSFITLNAVEMQGVMPALAGFGAVIFANSNRLKEALDNASTIEELNAIDITEGWSQIEERLRNGNG